MADVTYELIEDHIYRYLRRGQPRFMVRMTIDTVQHKKKQIETLHKARQHRDRIIERQAVPVARPKAATLREAGAAFLTSCKARRLAPNTVANYSLGLEHLCEQFGTRRVDTLTREEVRLFLEAKLAGDWEPGPGKTTRFQKRKIGYGMVRNHMLMPLTDLFTRLEVEDKIPKNPFRKLAKELGTSSDEGLGSVQVDPFTEQEVHLLLFVSRPPRQIPPVKGRRQPRVAPVEWMLTNMLAHTGLRWGEAAALKVADLDFDRRRISVSKTFTPRYGLREFTKGRKDRWVDLTPSLLDDLKAYVEWLRLEASAEGRSPILLFPDRSSDVDDGPRLTANGERYLAMRSYHRYFWYPVLMANGLPDKTPHQLRHSYATILIGKGAGIEYVSKQLGHADVTITDRVYNHWKPPVGERRGVDLLERGGA
jgi:integrase